MTRGKGRGGSGTARRTHGRPTRPRCPGGQGREELACLLKVPLRVRPVDPKRFDGKAYALVGLVRPTRQVATAIRAWAWLAGDWSSGGWVSYQATDSRACGSAAFESPSQSSEIPVSSSNDPGASAEQKPSGLAG